MTWSWRNRKSPPAFKACARAATASRSADLPALFQQRGVRLDNARAMAVSTAAQALFGDNPAPAQQGAGGTDNAAVDLSALSQLDLTTIPDPRRTPWRVLPENPVFHRGGDFRECDERRGG